MDLTRVQNFLQKFSALIKCGELIFNPFNAPEGDMFEQVEADFEVPGTIYLKTFLMLYIGGESYIMEMDGPKRGALISPR